MNAGPVYNCYLCGKAVLKYTLKPGEPRPADDLDPDHVRPKGLFPRPRPGNLITVPCCINCNPEPLIESRVTMVARHGHGRIPGGKA